MILPLKLTSVDATGGALLAPLPLVYLPVLESTHYLLGETKRMHRTRILSPEGQWSVNLEPN